jgi:hypothetical protein
MILDSINIDNIKDINNIKLGYDPYFYCVELYIRYELENDAYVLYSTYIGNVKGLVNYNEQGNNVNGEKFYIFNKEMNYNSLFDFFNCLIKQSQGRNIYETSILLQRYFDEQDVLFPNIRDYYFYLFDKIKKT